MASDLEKTVRDVCQRYGNDRTRMMDIVTDVQRVHGHVSGEAMDLIAAAVGTARVEVESVVTFYAFLTSRPKGKVIIRLCNDVIDRMKGADRVEKAFEEALGIRAGETTPDGVISLERTPCIGMCDQAPAAVINEVVVTSLSTDKAREIVARLKMGVPPKRLILEYGDGANAHDLVRAEVKNNIRRAGPVVLADYVAGSGLRKALAMSPVEVIREMKASRLRGRGGAGFPLGMKWEFTRNAAGSRKYLVCNADEGEPGTFKDRVILTERPHLLFEGMTVGGYAIGADSGILYLRAEYTYLRAWLEQILAERRDRGLLGRNIMGKAGFDFDIRIQMGAGAYVCGEETSLLSSCEGTRGDPKNRPPFPAQKGYLGAPTAVNNVETLCCVARIMEKGAGWFAEMGSEVSSGTKLLSVSGDCSAPGVYELPFGVTLAELLVLVGAPDAQAVQMAGPSGQLLARGDFGRKICFDDLATGGSVMVFGPDRDLLEIVDGFLEFFIEESCGYCTPCRVGNVLLREGLGRIRAGHGTPDDLTYLKSLAESVKTLSRCGLGQTSPNPVLTALRSFRPVFEQRLVALKDGLLPTFDLKAAVSTAEGITGRQSAHH
ncbi:MAG: NAD(P)H-dependent oxidoreductase subunit E [Deltaproteobacteria bacterium]|nr:NAD(P)H-dependent oxidoreductase subunit E [Deltaproteobacteria bacterium]